MSKFVGCVCIAAVSLMMAVPGLSVAATSATSLTYYLHYEGTSSDCVGDVYLDLEDYPDPGHRCSALEQQLEPVTWEPESFTPVTLDTTRQGSARMGVTGAAFESAAIKIRLYGVRNDGQKILVGRASSSEFSSDKPQLEVPPPGVPEFGPQTQLVTLFFSIRAIAKNASFTTVALETDLTGFAPGAYIELDNPGSLFTVPTIESPASTQCTISCPQSQPSPAS